MTLQELLPIAPIAKRKSGSPAASGAATFSRWKCFSCGKGEDAFDWLQQKHEITFTQAKQQLIQMINSITTPHPVTKLAPHPSVTEAPSTKIQLQMVEAMIECARVLWTEPPGENALAYLKGRGLSEWTIRRYWLGLQPTRGEISGLDIPAGITIPHYCQETNVCRAINVRRPEGSSPKYLLVSGSVQSLYLQDSLRDHHSGQRFADAFLMEGEFDALLLKDHIGSHAGVVTFCSAACRQIDPWLPYLAPLKRIFVVTDNDPAGERAASFLRAQLPQAVRVLPPAGAKDITDAWNKWGGGTKGSQELREWALGILRY
jgi:DNA primase